MLVLQTSAETQPDTAPLEDEDKSSYVVRGSVTVEEPTCIGENCPQSSGSDGKPQLDEAGASSEHDGDLDTPKVNEQTEPVKAEDPSSDATEEKSPGHPLQFRMALRAARPWSFTATLSPVALGTALALKSEQSFSLQTAVLTTVTTVAVHAAGNMMNTLFDFRKGVDGKESSDQTLVQNLLTPRQLTKLIFGAYGIAAASSIPLAISSHAPAELLAMWLAGALSAFVYTGGPGLKYKALGDVLISLTFGPLLVGYCIHMFTTPD